MNFMNDDANMKQFQLLGFINENCSDDHVISKISIVLRRDKIEAPYYMMNAMDIMNHQRMHNLTEERYNEIKSLICDAFDGNDESDMVKIFKKDKRLKLVFMSKNDDEFKSLFEKYHELFEAIDSLIE